MAVPEWRTLSYHVGKKYQGSFSNRNGIGTFVQGCIILLAYEFGKPLVSSTTVIDSCGMNPTVRHDVTVDME